VAHIHNAIHRFTGLLSAYRKALGEASEAFSGIERGGETLTPTIDLWSLPEWKLPRGEILYSRHVTSPGVALRFSSVELVNPVGSRVIAVCSVLLMDGGTNVQLAVENGVALGVTATTRGAPNDARHPGIAAASSKCTVVTGDLAAGIAVPQFNLIQDMQLDVPWILIPGSKLFGIASTVATGFDFSLVWSERELQDGELG
jgi:hypothetical protein